MSERYDGDIIARAEIRGRASCQQNWRKGLHHDAQCRFARKQSSRVHYLVLSPFIHNMIQVVKEGGVEQFEKAMPQHHWQRNKKQSVNYAHDSPFATERQLEDQRLLMQKNRNPQYLIPTKVDKVRSQVISSTMGASRSVAVKANVLNKIVREASGVHNYTIVAPIKTHDEKQKRDILEPETNPRVRPYAQEAKFKPVLCSFGHRPRSASRTFHPATMKFRLKHGEIARGGDNVHKTGFGLPVSVLKQVLKAPKLYRPGEGDFLFGVDLDASQLSENAADSSVLDEQFTEPVENYENLFFSEEEHRKMFKPVNQPKGNGRKPSNPSTMAPQNNTAWNASSQPTNDAQGSSYRPVQDDTSLGQASWVSSIEREQAAKAAVHKPPHLVYPKLEPLEGTDGRPSWDEAHHRVQHSSNHLFEMRASKLTTGSKALSLGDRLKRFAALSVAETQPVLFCTEKQETDKKILAGIEHKVPKPTSHLGRPVYLDPNNNELKIIKHYRKEDLQKENTKRKAREYQKLLKTIPKVEYFPTSRLAEMRSKSSLNEGSSDGNTSASANNGVDLENSTDIYNNTSNSTAPLHNTSASKVHNKFTTSMSSWSKYDTSVLENSDWQDTETKMRAAMKAAKAGDTRALYELNLQQSSSLMSKTLPPLDTGGVE